MPGFARIRSARRATLSTEVLGNRSIQGLVATLTDFAEWSLEIEPAEAALSRLFPDAFSAIWANLCNEAGRGFDWLSLTSDAFDGTR
jgi:hypothetical protein